jgi:hypothetical protein
VLDFELDADDVARLDRWPPRPSESGGGPAPKRKRRRACRSSLSLSLSPLCHTPTHPHTHTHRHSEDKDGLTGTRRLTTPESLAAFQALYEKCVLRDTPLAGTHGGEALVRRDITRD